MPAFEAPASGIIRAAQRSEDIATFELSRLTFHEAGTCLGSDIAAAATIVTRSIRRVHMIRLLQ
jgi:hypothetical protein